MGFPDGVFVRPGHEAERLALAEADVRGVREDSEVVAGSLDAERISRYTHGPMVDTTCSRNRIALTAPHALLYRGIGTKTIRTLHALR
jgi:hypothetical protein